MSNTVQSRKFKSKIYQLLRGFFPDGKFVWNIFHIPLYGKFQKILRWWCIWVAETEWNYPSDISIHHQFFSGAWSGTRRASTSLSWRPSRRPLPIPLLAMSRWHKRRQRTPTIISATPLHSRWILLQQDYPNHAPPLLLSLIAATAASFLLSLSLSFSLSLSLSLIGVAISCLIFWVCKEATCCYLTLMYLCNSIDM